MVEKSILRDSSEHIEIEILGEIEGLLCKQERVTTNSFLHKILNKTSELIGADSGSISILKNIDEKSWLVVENKDGSLIGAKSRGWTKNKIPAIPVGGDDLPDSSKVAQRILRSHSPAYYILKDVQDADLN